MHPRFAASKRRVLTCIICLALTVSILLLTTTGAARTAPPAPPASPPEHSAQQRRGGAIEPPRGAATSPTRTMSTTMAPLYDARDLRDATLAWMANRRGEGESLGAMSSCLLLMHIPKTAGNSWIEAFYRGELHLTGEEVVNQWKSTPSEAPGWRYYAHRPDGRRTTLRAVLRDSAEPVRASLWVGGRIPA